VAVVVRRNSLARESMLDKPCMYDEAVGIVGGGIMGAGIAEVPARDGFDGRVREVDGAAAQTACWRATPRRSPS
jgi:glycerol-3-phosphate dehydrogenase